MDAACEGELNRLLLRLLLVPGPRARRRAAAPAAQAELEGRLWKPDPTAKTQFRNLQDFPF